MPGKPAFWEDLKVQARAAAAKNKSRKKRP